MKMLIEPIFLDAIIRKRKLLTLITIGLLGIGIIVAVIVLVVDRHPKKSTIHIGAVVTNGYSCAEIGRSILEKNGTAVEAAIAAMFCEGVSMPQSCGLGGGFLMTVYIRNEQKAYALNAREVAPERSTVNMFDGNSSLSQRGYLAVAVPGELRGYWLAYQKFGGVTPWKDLIQPTIDLCNNGILVTDFLDTFLKANKHLLYNDPELKTCFINSTTNEPYVKGQYIKRLKFAKTLEVIAKEGGDALHNGSLTVNFVKDIQDNGGIITENDMRSYEPVWTEITDIDLPFQQTLYSIPLPGSGIILSYILNILKRILDFSNPSLKENYQRIAEGFKFGYAKRSELGDRDTEEMAQLVKNLTSEWMALNATQYIFDNRTSQDPGYYGANTSNIDDHGTAHISVLAPNGDAVALTSTVNFYFGADVSSNSTGIILNDQMDDFSSPNVTNGFGVPPSISNFIEPGKRPISSMCPAIIVDHQGDVKLILGAAGGTKITTSVALVLLRHLWYNMTITDSLDDNRMHHQLLPMILEMEDSFAPQTELLDYLRNVGHNITLTTETGFSAVTAISNMTSSVTAAFDKRRTGDIAYIV